MLLTLSTTHRPATDLGYLLHKNPDRVHEVKLSFGRAEVFYPEASEARCTAALMMDVDPVALVRGRRGRWGRSDALTHYVNDRPYVASSFLSVAIARCFATAMAGRSKQRPELVDTPLPFEVRVTPLSRRGGEDLFERLFEPLGYAVEADGGDLDPAIPDWGASPYFTLTLAGRQRLRDLLAHLYVLIPVLDRDKHYWIGDDEVEKLLRRGEGWLAEHPEKEFIAQRYLKRRGRLTREALARLNDDPEDDPEAKRESQTGEEESLEKPIRLNDQRLRAVHRALADSGARRVLDLGCGGGRLLEILLGDKQFEKIVGVDTSLRSLELAARRLRLERMAPLRRARIELLQGALTYRDRRLAGYDGAAVVEVIEHLDPPRLAAFERALFECARPRVVVITTPNIEYNVRFETLPAGQLRHKDHRFEWTRREFRDWAESVSSRFGYGVRFEGLGELDPEVGTPSQMGIFSRCD